MSGEESVKTPEVVTTESRTPAVAETTDPKQKALALGLEFCKRAQEAESLDELFFMLTNDLRILVEFDRALLITHVGGESNFVAATQQPVLQKKFKFYKVVNDLAIHMKGVEKGVWLSADAPAENLSEEELPPEVRDRLLSYMKLAESSFLLCSPLKHNKTVLGHIILEFGPNNQPNQIEVLTILSIAPFFATALSEKWLMQAKPGLWKLVSPDSNAGRSTLRRAKILSLLAVLAVIGIYVFFLLPMDLTVGGECEVVPKKKRMAFVKIDGLVESISVKEGSQVEKGQVIALLDRTDLDHDIKTAARRLEILTKEMGLLRRESGTDPSKLAESKLVRLKRAGAAEELTYLKWKSQFLEVKAPVTGIVISKDVDTFAGKKFKAGEPFCQIAVPGDLWITVYAPEDKISLVRKGQPLDVYLNSEPSKGYPLSVTEIVPAAEVLPRLGNVFNVRAPFVDAPAYVKIGMKGIGRIETQETNLAHIIARRFRTRWNQFSIYF
jgi:Barrel-sandwich domain of CusB or HlyD membrane-fusion